MTDVTNYETEAEARERLAKAVESFDGTDKEARELSDQVLLAMGWFHRSGRYIPGSNERMDKWYTPDDRPFPHDRHPHPLRNAQDALDLLPEGWQLVHAEHDGLNPWRVTIWDGDTGYCDKQARTFQAAITAAALRAGG